MTIMVMIMLTETLTYKELAVRLGIKLASARRLVMRKRWPKAKGNDGETRITIPVEALERPDDTHDDSHTDNHNAGHNANYIKELQSKIETLNEVLASERQRADAYEKRAISAESDRDRWHVEATKPFLRKLFG